MSVLYTNSTPSFMLQQVRKETDKFVALVPKSQRKIYGQFFTNLPTARFMASLFDFNLEQKQLKLLDAGAGTGMLSAAMLGALQTKGYSGHVHLVCYETDVKVLPILTQNLRALSEQMDLTYEIRTDNYLASQPFEAGLLFNSYEESFDYIIGNPPYLKIGKNSSEALAMPEVCYGAPNLYFLFCAMGIRQLKTEAELVYIIPRSWTSGAYFQRFRDYLHRYCAILHIHLFESRDKVFEEEKVLQETMIIKIRKTLKRHRNISVTTSVGTDFRTITSFDALYRSVVSRDGFVFLVTNSDDLQVVETLKAFPHHLLQLGLKMQTGLIVNFRTKKMLRDRMEREDAYPLLYPQHVQGGRIVWPIGKSGEVIKTKQKSYFQDNADYLIVKRFTSKEEKRRLQCAIYLQEDYPQYRYISTQNKINFIRCKSKYQVLGLYVLFNSSLYDQYYRILNGSTQVNSTEINQMPLPDLTTIEMMGKELDINDLSTTQCNKILKKWISRKR